MHYNLSVSTTRFSCWFVILIGLAIGCGKKPTSEPGQNTPSGSNQPVGSDGSSGSAAPLKIDRTPVPGIEIGQLDEAQQTLFYTLVDSLDSPCGPGKSLRSSIVSDTSCKRAPYAGRLVVELIAGQATEEIVRKLYTGKYDSKEPPAKVDVSKAPRHGATDAPIKIVEFYDYACSHCIEAKPIMDEIIDRYGDKVAVYYMMFPIVRPSSKQAGQAVLAAAAQGKFKAMHDLLFQTDKHDDASLKGYAAALTLDAAKFEKDFEAAAAQVDSDKKQGVGVGVTGTPTIFINEHRYVGSPHPKLLALYIEEELGVNR